jgi:hypothetical protein
MSFVPSPSDDGQPLGAAVRAVRAATAAAAPPNHDEFLHKGSGSRSVQNPGHRSLPQFDYEADLLAADGKTGVDTAWLREQFDMSSDLAD